MRRKSRENSKSSTKLDFTLSISDIMSGLLFIFIIILIYFMLEAQNIKREFSENRQLQTKVLKILKEKIEKELRLAFKDDKIKVDVIEDQGVLRLPDRYFFKSAEYELLPEGKQVIKALRKHIFETLNCQTSKIDGLCSNGLLKIESFFIEGHTDCEPIGSSLKRKGINSNIRLSSMRSLEAFDELIGKKSKYNLMQLHNLNDEPVLSISGYGEFRSINHKVSCDKKTRKDNASDRRIEFKIVMHLPLELTKAAAK